MEVHVCNHSLLEVDSRMIMSSRLHSETFPKKLISAQDISAWESILHLPHSLSEDDMSYDGMVV